MPTPTEIEPATSASPNSRSEQMAQIMRATLEMTERVMAECGPELKKMEQKFREIAKQHPALSEQDAKALLAKIVTGGESVEVAQAQACMVNAAKKGWAIE